MLLCLDVGNSQLFGGVFHDDELKLRFRYNTREIGSSDQIGIFLKQVIRENDLVPEEITDIAFCSVVPQLDYSLRGACQKYFSIDPFILQPGVKTGLKLLVNEPKALGSDRVATGVGACHLHKGQNIINIDFGTATTFCAISKNSEYLGGSIVAGLKLALQSLQNNTAKLSSTEIIQPSTSVGKTTAEHLQIGLYYGHLGIVKEMIARMTAEAFKGQKPLVLATGGFAYLFEQEAVFDHIYPDLVLQGLRFARQLNLGS